MVFSRAEHSRRHHAGLARRSRPLHVEPLEDRHLPSASLFLDFNPGSASSGPWIATVVEGTLFFPAADGVHGHELWKTDGTPNGTTLVRDIVPGTASPLELHSLTNVGGTLFFLVDDRVHGRELWRSDGTEDGTALIKDIRPGLAGSAEPFSLVVVNGTLYFVADDGIHGRELWRSDGTEEGTILVKDVRPGSAGGFGERFTQLLSVNGQLLFPADDGIHGRELWRSDGTEEGTVLVADIYPGPRGGFFEEWAARVNDTLFFVGLNGQVGGLWKSDGTEEGTVFVKAVTPSGLTNRNGTLFFVGLDDAHGMEPWTSDGTPEGTFLVKDILPGPQGSFGYPDTTVMGDAVFFEADDGVHGPELWRSDSTAGGTFLVKDITPGFQGSAIHIGGAMAHDGLLFFQLQDGGLGDPSDLWQSDGTNQGTISVKNSVPGRGIFGARPLVGFQGSLFFAADDGVHGRELWVADPQDLRVPSKTVSGGRALDSGALAALDREQLPCSFTNWTHCMRDFNMNQDRPTMVASGHFQRAMMLAHEAAEFNDMKKLAVAVNNMAAGLDSMSTGLRATYNLLHELKALLQRQDAPFAGRPYGQ